MRTDMLQRIEGPGFCVRLFLVITTLSCAAEASADTLYVSYPTSNAVEKFDLASGTDLGVFAAGLSEPYGLTVDSIGNVYVANASNNTIMKISPSGVASVFASSGLDLPTGLASDSSGNIYAGNPHSFQFVPGYIEKFTPNGVGTFFATTGNDPSGIGVDSANNVWVANANSYTVEEIASNGSTTTTFGTASQPSGVAIDSAGNAYVSIFQSNVVEKFSSTGSDLGVFASAGLNGPAGLAFDSAGNLYVANTGSNNILKFTPAGIGSVFAVTTTGSPASIAIRHATNPYAYGFFSTSSTCASSSSKAPFSIAGGVTVDGYDSDNGGTYAATSAKNLGSVGSNGSVFLSGGAAIGGDVYVPNTALAGQCPVRDLFASGGATYGGIVGISAFNPTVPSIPPAGGINVSVGGGSHQTLSPGSYNNISVGGGATLTLTAPGSYNFNCLAVNNGATLTISPATQPVVLNIVGASCDYGSPINFSGGSIINTSGIATNLTINYAGSNSITLSGAANTYIVVNAPNAAVTLNGGAQIFGAIVGGTIAVSNGVALHFDNSLRHGGP